MKTISKIYIACMAIPLLAIVILALKTSIPNPILSYAFLVPGFFILLQKLFGKNLPGGIAFKIYQRFFGYMFFVVISGIAFRFLYYAGWHLMLNVALLTLPFTLLIFIKWGAIRKKHFEQYEKYMFTLFWPTIFVTALFLFCIILPDKVFYETFSSRSLTQNYEQFKSENPMRTGYELRFGNIYKSKN